MARKCSLPIRLPDPGTDTLPEDSRPKEVSDEKIEDFALRAFFYDYCIVSMNRSISRGYLDGLELMLRHRGPQSDLAKACKVVAFASHGLKLRRPALTWKAEMLYQEMLGSLARAIEYPVSGDNAASLMIAMLLGLYEIIVASEAHPSNHNAHARGVAAILQIEKSPMDLLGAVRFTRSGHPAVLNRVFQNCGLFSASYSSNFMQTLDDLLLMFGPIWRKADALMENPLVGNPLMGSDELDQLREEAMALNQSFAKWEKAQAEELKPRIVGRVRQRQVGSHLEAGYWPGRVDTYFDLYAAGVWNTCRTARLLLINMVLKISKLLKDNQDHDREHQDALRLREDVVASIPYHLAEDVQIVVRDAGKGVVTMNPGRTVGGLLLMHPIYVASKLSIVPQQTREYLRRCLTWSGIHMGIGQASLLAQTPEVSEQYFADGCMIVWAGMLV